MSTLLVSCVDGRLRETLGELEMRLAADDGDRLLMPGGPLVVTDSAVEHEHVLGWLDAIVQGYWPPADHS